MFDQRAVTALKGLIKWGDDVTGETPAFVPPLSTSESGQSYQQFKADLIRIDYISALMRPNYVGGITAYLDDVETAAINIALNKLVEEKKLNNDGQDIITENLILPNVIRGDAITNESRFVGVEFVLNDYIGIRAVINRIGLYLTAAEAGLTLYLFNSLQPTSVNTFTYISTTANSFQWIDQEVIMDFDNGVQIAPEVDTSGGVWYLGYYQDALTGQAIEYKTMNWSTGGCLVCPDTKTNAQIFRQISGYVQMTPFYIASANVPAVGTMFDPDDIVYNYNSNFGFNFNVTIKCNLTQFWIDNRATMKELIGKTVVWLVLQMYAGSSQVSAVQQNVRILALRALEADKDTKASKWESQVNRAVKTTNFDHGNVNNNPCIPCSRKGGHWGTM